MSEVFNSSVLDAINRAVQDGISTTALEVDGTPQYCIINAETREIEIPGELNIFGVESDEKSTRVYFRCPKYVGTNVDLDMTQCMVYVPYRNANGEKDQYIVTDLNETEDSENVEFTWLISRKASAYMGITEFGIRAIKTATGGTIEAEWNTTVASANVIRGMDVGLLEFSEENTDAIAQAVDLVKQEIELKGQEIIATIPDDYTTVAQNALSAKNEVEDIRVGYDGTEYESAGEAVREQVSSLKGDLGELGNELVNITAFNRKSVHLDFERGGISNGNDVDGGTSRIRTKQHVPIDDGITIVVNDGYKITVVFYKEDSVVLTQDGWHEGTYVLKDYKYYSIAVDFRIMVGKVDNSDLDVDDVISNVSIQTDAQNVPSDKSVNINKLDNKIKEKIDEVNHISNDLNMITTINKKGVYYNWIQGGLSSGIPNDSSNRIYTDGFTPVNENIIISATDGYKFSITFYYSDGSISSNIEWLTGSYKLSNYKYLQNTSTYKLVLAKSDDSDITTSDSNNLSSVMDTINNPSDLSVSIQKFSADVRPNIEKLFYQLEHNGFIIQLFNKDSVDKTGMYLSSGSFWKTDKYFSTGLFPVVGGMKLVNNYSTNTSSSIVTLWDANGVFIPNDELSYKGDNPIIIPENKGVCFARMSIPYQSYSEDIQIVSSDFIPSKKLRYMGVVPYHYRDEYSNYVGCKMSCFGDSFTGMGRWQPTVKGYLGLKEVQGFFQDGGTLVNIYNQIENVDDDTDIVTVWIGTNDYGTSRPLGTLNDSIENPTTYYGCLRYVAEWLQTNKPNTTILFITPMQRNDTTVSSFATTNGVNDRGMAKNNIGYVLEDYVDAMINVANLYNIPYWDCYRMSGVGKLNIMSHTDEGLHPTVEEGRILGRKIAMEINRN